MKALVLAYDQIKAGSSSLVIAGGMNSMSNAPYFLDKARAGMRLGHGEIEEYTFFDRSEDACSSKSKGALAQEVSAARSIGREAMDDRALSSLQRAQTAIAAGHFKQEVAPAVVSTRANEATSVAFEVL